MKGRFEAKRLVCLVNYDRGRKKPGEEMPIIFKMKVIIIGLDIRGLNDNGKRNTIKSLIRKWKADILCLKETKI